jgi:Protein of unknown function (DUF3570)
MKKRTSLALLTAAASTLVQADDKVSLQYLTYQENDKRIAVDDYAISIESNPNVNHQIKVNVGIDTISGASPAWQPKVTMSTAPQIVKSASSSNVYGIDNAGYSVQNVTVPEEQRTSAGISWLSRDKKRHELSLGLDYSEEPDYVSRSASANYLWFADRYKNRSFSLGASLQSNQSLAFDSSYQSHWEDLLASNVQLGASQVMSQRSSIDGNIFVVYDTGYLSNHYQTILRKFDGNNDGIQESYLSAEQRPEERKGFGLASNWLVQWTNNLSTHAGIRLYQDDWGIDSQTYSGKSYLNIDDQWTLHLLARYYQQSAASFYKDPNSDKPEFSISGFGSADHRLGDYSATSFEIGLAYEWQTALIINGQVGSYQHNTGFIANWFSTGMIVKY